MSLNSTVYQVLDSYTRGSRVRTTLQCDGSAVISDNIMMMMAITITGMMADIGTSHRDDVRQPLRSQQGHA